jgi:hypothetical protein
MTFVPVGWAMIASTIWDADWLVILRPQTQQCGVPARAKRTRR